MHEAPAAGRPTDAGLPEVPGYDVEEELGRGGMGVVYRAVHRRLRRVVALKMILTAGQVLEHEADRFRGEAEAVARLQHPGIVQVYEVGEHHGQPYIALEYLPGGSLEQVFLRGPMRPRGGVRAPSHRPGCAGTREAAHR